MKDSSCRLPGIFLAGTFTFRSPHSKGYGGRTWRILCNPRATSSYTFSWIHHLFLKLNSWGMTLAIFSHPKIRDCNPPAPPPRQKHFCIGTTLLFLFSRRMAASVENFSTTVGTQVTPTHTTLPNFQMGANMFWAKVLDLAWSADTFSIVKPKLVGDAHCMPSHDTLPPWIFSDISSCLSYEN